MASGYVNFDRSNINIKTSPEYDSNFIRIMSMMAVPPGGNIFDVFPKNGIKPLMFNKYDNNTPCIGVLDLVNNEIDEENAIITIAITGYNILSEIELDDQVAVFMGGTPIFGSFVRHQIGSLETNAFRFPIERESYDIFMSALSVPPSTSIPVWKVNRAITTIGGVEPTTTIPVTTGDPFGSLLIMDYYVDWTGGNNVSPVPASEMVPFISEETVSRVYMEEDEVCQWKKLCNATGMSVNVDTANHKLSVNMSMGIITSGNPSVKEPQYFLIYVDNNVFIRIYCNIHEINYKTLGRYDLNSAQCHDVLYLRDQSVFGNVVVTEGSATYTITTPPESSLWAEFWSQLDIIKDDTDLIFFGKIHLLDFGDDPYWIDVTMSYVMGSWVIGFEVPEGSGMISTDDVWGDLIINGVYVTKLVTVTIPDETDAPAEIAIDPVSGEKYLNRLSKYSMYYSGSEYDLWWGTEQQKWLTERSIGSFTAPIRIISRTMSIDAVDFSTQEDNNMLFLDNGIYPESVYYFRARFTWSDIIVSTIGKELWIKEANVYGSQLPIKYGIYSLSNYTIDEYGNKSYDASLDITGNSRFCGIYGRNGLYMPSDTYLSGLGLYPNGTEFCLYYPPMRDKVLLTRANTGINNYIKYIVTSNKIKFDLSEQLLGDLRNPTTYATGYINLSPDGSTAKFTYNYPGISGNGYIIDIVITPKASANVIIGPVDNVLKIFIPPLLIETTIYDIVSAINARRGIDYKIGAEIVQGTGTEPEDVITENTTIVLMGGGDEMIISNMPQFRSPGDIILHPGYMLNSSRRQSPINKVGIYAYFLSANYQCAGKTLDVVAVNTQNGIDLYLAVYMGELLSRYTIKEDISTIDTDYSDPELGEEYAGCELPTSGSPLVITSKSTGWTGNGIVFSYELRDIEYWLKMGWDPGDDFVYTEDLSTKKCIISALCTDGTPNGTLTSDEFAVLIGSSALIETHTGATVDMEVKEMSYGLYGGSGGFISDMVYLHNNGNILALKVSSPGNFTVERDLCVGNKWYFAGEEVDLLTYKLENTRMGAITEECYSEDRTWTVPGEDNYSEVCAKIDTRTSLSMLKYISVDNIEVEIESISYANDEYTIVVTENGNNAILNSLRSKKELVCGLNDIYFPTSMYSDSINKPMIYYGNYMREIELSIPTIEKWGSSLIPYYVVSLFYSLTQS